MASTGSSDTDPADTIDATDVETAGLDPDDEGANPEADAVAARRGGTRRGRSPGAAAAVKAAAAASATGIETTDAPPAAVGALPADAVATPADVPGGASFSGPGTSGDRPSATSSTVHGDAAAAAMPVAPVPAGSVEVPFGDTVAASLPVTRQRDHYALLDPAAPSATVAEVSPYAPEGPMAGYVKAPCDAVALVYPQGCKTPVTQTLWHEDQRVPADQYAAWRAQQPDPSAAHLEPKPDNPPVLRPDVGPRDMTGFNSSGFSAPASI